MSQPTIALWGTGGPAAAHAAACRALGWTVRCVAGASAADTARLARQVGAEALTAGQFGASRHADVVILADRMPPHEIGAVLDTGSHLVIAPPLADTLAGADSIVEATRTAASNGQGVLYGEAMLAAPAVEALLSSVSKMDGAVTHTSSKSVQPLPPADPSHRSPLLHHGVHGIAAALLVGRLTGRGSPIGVVGARSGRGQPVTDGWMHYSTGDPVRVHASFGPPSGPSWDLQVATAAEVFRVDMFPTPTLERNGDSLPISGRAAQDPRNMFGYAPQLDRFWGDITAGRPPMFPSDLGRDVLEVVCAAHASVDRDPEALPFNGPRDHRPHDLEAGS